MKLSTLSIVVLALILLAGPVQAAQLTPTMSFDNTDLTTGTTRTISVTVTGSGSAATISSLSLSSSCLTVSDPSGGSYSSFSAATGGTTKDFVVTSGTAGTCTFSASSLEQSQNSPSTSTEGTLVFVNTNAIGVTVDDDAAGSYTSGQNYTFTVTLSNSLNSSISVGYNITKAAQTTKQTGDVTNDTITLTAGATLQLNWSFSSTSSDTVYFYVGDNLAHSAAITIPSTTTSAGTTGGSGGSSTAAASTTKVTFSIDKITTAGVTKTISKEAIPVTELKVTVTEQLTSVTLEVSALSSQPASVTTVPSSKVVYQFIQVSTTNLPAAKVKSASLTFKVNSSWIEANNIDKNKVFLLRYNNGWETYPATLTGEGDTTLTYTASVPGFSVFSITGQVAAVTPTPTATPTATPTVEPTSTATPTAKPTLPSSLPNPPDIALWFIAGIIIVVVIVVAVYKMKLK